MIFIDINRERFLSKPRNKDFNIQKKTVEWLDLWALPELMLFV